MAVQYLKELMSIYKGTSMKLKYEADYQHNKHLMTYVYASFVHLNI